VSEDAKNLIRKMLNVDPVERISAKDAYNDPWIQKNSTNTPLDAKSLKNLGTFVVTHYTHTRAKTKSKQRSCSSLLHRSCHLPSGNSFNKLSKPSIRMVMDS
jgi:serine/threonine protein kinase